MSYKYQYISHVSNPGKLYDPVIKTFRKRIYSEDNDVFLIIAGPRGSTKSGDGISLGYQTDTDDRGRSRFYLDKRYFPSKFKLLPSEKLPRVIYKPSHLMDMLKNNTKYPMGTCILWDEVGVEGDARDFATKKNKLLKRTFQTIRSLNWFIILTAVTIKDFDVGLERNAGFYMQTFGKTKLPRAGKMKPYGITKFYELNVNPRTGKRYTPFLKYKQPGDVQKKLSEIYYVRKPPWWLENPYKRYKRLFQTKLYSEYSHELDNIEDYAVDERTGREIDVVNDKIKEVAGNPMDYYDLEKKKFVLAAVQFLGDLKIESEPMARKVIHLLNFKVRKGEITVDS